ncbi:diaminopimelate decarboxylase [Hazenella sp. IB182357]|uniref:Diaminopimelate decarboxylase n=1 Tax=Polycladospora coralii TaxID=2771432 RepID=A0A926NAG4_9BACL|nr:diaminopimelate decarboxylase [Polycladospora coralii]MBD1372848.1 diaminopimelate decarboxylase [Polycladospora coralii]
MRKEYKVQGIPISHIAAEFGTPLYVYDGDILTEDYTQLRKKLPPYLEFFYSLKANPNISIYHYLKRLGARAEVSSLVELQTVLQAGTDPQNIIFLGPGKNETELRACIENKIYAIVCESIQELQQIQSLALELGVTVDVAIRINPSFSVKGSRLTMGGKPRQFGIDEETVFAQLNEIKALSHVRVMGMHVYMGTRILDEEVIVQNTSHIFQLAERFQDQLGVPLEMVDIGGGLGVPYFEGEQKLNVDRLADLLNPVIHLFREANPHIRLIMELGRYLAGRSGILVTQVKYIKESFGEPFLVADGGTNCHMAAVGIGSFVKRNFPIRQLSDIEGEDQVAYHITGPLCTPNDQLGKKVKLPPVEVGDLLGIFHSGAYGPTASPVLFLSHGYPAEVLVHQQETYLIRERDQVEDLLEKQHLHAFSEKIASRQ